MKKIPPIFFAFAILAFTLIFYSCQHTDVIGNDLATTPTPDEGFVGGIGITKTGYWRGDKITYQEVNGKAYFEGDIEIDLSEISHDETTKTAEEGAFMSVDIATEKKYLWPNKTIVYSLNSDLNADAKSRVREAIAYWQSLKLLDFVKKQLKQQAMSNSLTNQLD